MSQIVVITLSKQEFGAKLLALRKQKQVSQAEAASYLCLTVAAYQNYEAGRREAGYETISKLADFYNVTADYLLGRDSESKTALESLASEYRMNTMEKTVLQNYLDSPIEIRKAITEILHKPNSEDV